MIDEIGIPTTEIEADGFITPSSALERTAQDKAKPLSACPYPDCEECFNYIYKHCTVPIVVSKQMYKDLDCIIQKLTMQIESLMFETMQLKEEVFRK